jgi:2-dehydro-3-deoxyphosphogalactonate aldolase
VRIIEVPLNSPQPLSTASPAWRRRWVDQALIGAGTVLTPARCRPCGRAGARLVLSPNFDPAVVQRARPWACSRCPAWPRPAKASTRWPPVPMRSSCFPAEMLGPPVLKAWRAVFPPGTAMLPVGGVGLGNLAAFKAAGAVGAGIGSSLYAPGVAPAELKTRAAALVQAWAAA